MASVCDNLILFDWFAFTAKNKTPDDVVRLLGLQDVKFTEFHGSHGYVNRLYFEKISIHYGGREEVWCEMSGQGCRAFETYGHGNWPILFEVVRSSPDYHVTRLDVAFDDHTGLLPLHTKMLEDFEKGNYVSRFRSWRLDKSNLGISLYHGNMKQSEIAFRIYDKAVERGREEEGHWVRFELQLRRDRAKQFIDLLILQPIGETFCGVVNNYIRYVKPTRDQDRDRWPMTGYWKEFVGSAEKIKLYQKPGVEYNFSNLHRFVVNQAGSAIATYVALQGVDRFLECCNDQFLRVQNAKHIKLLESRAGEVISEEQDHISLKVTRRLSTLRG